MITSSPVRFPLPLETCDPWTFSRFRTINCKEAFRRRLAWWPAWVSSLCSLSRCTFLSTKYVLTLVFTIMYSTETLSLAGNLLSGTIPNFSNLSQLAYLYLYKNQLRGQLTNSLFDLSKLGKIAQFCICMSFLTPQTHCCLYLSQRFSFWAQTSLVDPSQTILLVSQVLLKVYICRITNSLAIFLRHYAPWRSYVSVSSIRKA